MRLEEAFSRVVDIEKRELLDHPMWRTLDVWPLMRQSLWFELTQVEEPAGLVSTTAVPSPCRRLLGRVCAGVRAWRNRAASSGDETIAFISRPVYLQKLPDGTLFDRIVDPLVFCTPEDVRQAKYYVAPWPDRQALHYPAKLLRAMHTPSPTIPDEHRMVLLRMAEASGVSAEKLLGRYARSLQTFDQWHEAGIRFFSSRPHLKTVYLTSWYFPDMMGLVAAARKHGVVTVDVQHGKQGKLQAMYSGWHIPDGGYQMVPDVFWCWGQPSAQHILASSPDREKHRPVVGGYPWLDYYQRHVSDAHGAPNGRIGKRVLVTTQPRQGENVEPVPDFLIEFLRHAPQGVRFVFRCHPNDRGGLEYCRRRLSDLPASVYEIDDGAGNLYDSMIAATHHITAYSSCCYEARTFGVPTLLFGTDARTIYGEEIETGLFSWTPGSTSDLSQWLDTTRSDTGVSSGGYILSSLDHAATVIGQCTEGRDIECHEMKVHFNA